jgi:hypothetical protein
MDFNDSESLNNLIELVELIKNMDGKIHIILLIRDANSSENLKGDL